jgi:hypothetical protein
MKKLKLSPGGSGRQGLDGGLAMKKRELFLEMLVAHKFI